MTVLPVSDRLDLGELLARYAAAADQREWPELVELFVEDGVLAVPDPPRSLLPSIEHTGRDAIRDAVASLAPFVRTVHHLTGSTWSADGDAALGRTTAVAHHVEDGPEPRSWVWHLTYDDRCVRSQDGWRFEHRALTLLLVEARPVVQVLPFGPLAGR